MDINDMLNDCTGFKEHENISSKLIIKGEKNNPKVSVMIPTFRRLDFLKQAVMSAINQVDFDDFEIVVIDNEQFQDGAIENFIKELNSPRLSLYRNEKNIGMIGNWNRCIQLAKGSWIVILHDDDLMKPCALLNLMANMKGNSLVASSTEIFGIENRLSIRKIIKEFIYIVSRFIKFSSGKKKLDGYDTFIDCPICASGALFNKRACIDLGGYNQKYWPISDYLFSLRYILKFGGIKLKNTLIRYRLSVNESNAPEVYLQVPSATYNLRLNYLSILQGSDAYKTWILFLSRILLYLDEQIAFNILISNNSIAVAEKKIYMSRYSYYNRKIPFPAACTILIRIFLLFKKKHLNPMG